MMSNATMPSFKDSDGRLWEVTVIHFDEKDQQPVCEITALTDIDDENALKFFDIYSDGRFIQESQQLIPDSTPIKSAFYNAVMAMFNLED